MDIAQSSSSYGLCQIPRDKQINIEYISGTDEIYEYHSSGLSTVFHACFGNQGANLQLIVFSSLLEVNTIPIKIRTKV
jgi:hypothetical protein